MSSDIEYNAIELQCPIDCIFETNKYIVACGYLHTDANRSGMVYFIDKTTYKVLDSVETTGTLHGCCCGDRIYLANVDNVSLFHENHLIKICDTGSFNTYVCVHDGVVYVSDISGNIRVLDTELNQISIIKGSSRPIWILKRYMDRLYFGDEAGFTYYYDCRTSQIQQLGKQREGIIDMIFRNNEVFISSYDGNIEVYGLETSFMTRKIENVGALWKMIEYDGRIVASSIYDGLKIFDSEFNQITQIKTETICYGVYCVNDVVLWAPFYSNIILWNKIDSFC